MKCWAPVFATTAPGSRSWEPTVREIRAHLAGGGVIARRSTPTAMWVMSSDVPQIALRNWEAMPDQDAPMPNYRLVVVT